MLNEIRESKRSNSRHEIKNIASIAASKFGDGQDSHSDLDGIGGTALYLPPEAQIDEEFGGGYKEHGGMKLVFIGNSFSFTPFGFLGVPSPGIHPTSGSRSFVLESLVIFKWEL